MKSQINRLLGALGARQASAETYFPGNTLDGFLSQLESALTKQNTCVSSSYSGKPFWHWPKSTDLPSILSIYSYWRPVQEYPSHSFAGVNGAPSMPSGNFSRIGTGTQKMFFFTKNPPNINADILLCFVTPFGEVTETSNDGPCG